MLALRNQYRWPRAWGFLLEYLRLTCIQQSVDSSGKTKHTSMGRIANIILHTSDRQFARMATDDLYALANSLLALVVLLWMIMKSFSILNPPFLSYSESSPSSQKALPFPRYGPLLHHQLASQPSWKLVSFPQTLDWFFLFPIHCQRPKLYTNDFESMVLGQVSAASPGNVQILMFISELLNQKFWVGTSKQPVFSQPLQVILMCTKV